jgi:hypothetical protein
MRCSRHLSADLVAGSVLDVPDGHVQGLVGSETRGARGLVADGEVEGALLVDTPVADRVENVEQLVVLGDVAVGLLQARGDVVHAVGSSEGNVLALVEERTALAGGTVLVVHVDSATLMRLDGGRLAKGEVVPGIVGDVVGTAGLVDPEEVDAAAAVGDLNADVVAADAARPVGNAVGVDLATQDTDGRGVLLVGSDADGAGGAALELSRGSGDDGGRSSKKGGDKAEHVVKVYT